MEKDFDINCWDIDAFDSVLNAAMNQYHNLQKIEGSLPPREAALLQSIKDDRAAISLAKMKGAKFINIEAE